MPEVVVVPGTSVQEDGSPGYRLDRRMERAVGYLLEHPGALLLVSGRSIGGRAPEALVMRNAALAAGIAEARILVEQQAGSTWENAAYSAALLRPLAPSRIILVTDRIHMPRARLAFRAQGLAVSPVAADWPDPRTPRTTVLAALGYEGLALAWYAVRLALQHWGQGS
jgi:uncharacterized SAM-binding protein YcdF (DUF218 family)